MRAWVVVTSMLLFEGIASAQEPADVLEERGCLACHTIDGTRGPSTSFIGLYGRTRVVTSGGTTHSLVVDDEYLARSIREPGLDVVEGYAAMPDFHVPDGDVDALVRAIRELPAIEPPYQSIWILVAGAAGFLFFHLFLSWHPVRRRLVKKLGEKKYQGVYALIVTIPFIAIFVGWMVRPFIPLYDLGDGARWIPLVIMPLSFVLLVAGYLTKNPASVGQETALADGPRGITTITRHPALWGFALWALCHAFPNGDLASLLLFGSIFALAVLGMLHIDRRRERALGEPWRGFVHKTSIIPFVAILRGRCKLDLRGFFVRALVGLALFTVMLLLHEWEFGVAPYPHW